MLNGKCICVIGTGNMGEALVSGLVSSKAAQPEHIICTDISKPKLETIAEKYKVQTTTSNIGTGYITTD